MVTNVFLYKCIFVYIVFFDIKTMYFKVFTVTLSILLIFAK